MLRTVALRLTFLEETARESDAPAVTYFCVEDTVVFVCLAKERREDYFCADARFFSFPFSVLRNANVCFGRRYLCRTTLSLLRGFGLSEEGRKEEWPQRRRGKTDARLCGQLLLREKRKKAPAGL